MNHEERKIDNGEDISAINKEKNKVLPGQFPIGRQLEGELMAILNSVQEAIEIADKGGCIRYVNPTFERFTGIQALRRVGQNIFSVSPDGALAKALMTQKPVVGHRTVVGGSGVEVISNAAPILVEGSLHGAVVVFQPVTDILKLTEQLDRSNTVIEDLYARLGQLSSAWYAFTDLVGASRLFRATVEMARRASKVQAPVLITGESGTGKELYAHIIHHTSSRRDKPFVRVNCVNIAPALLEGELFGYEKGSFSSLSRAKLGRAELANGGTLFLDEIGEMDRVTQGKLLRLLRETRIQRVGASETVRVDVRMICSSNRDLRQQVRRGNLDEELYRMLSVTELPIPSLRERKEDIPPLVDYIIPRLKRELGKKVSGVSPEGLQALVNYDWPGNVRELEGVLERAMVRATGEGKLDVKLIRSCLGIDTSVADPYLEVMPLEKMEILMIRGALAKYGLSLEGKRQAAKALGISLATLYNKIKRYQVHLV